MMHHQMRTRVMLVGNGHFKMEKKSLFTVVTKIKRKNHTTSQFILKKNRGIKNNTCSSEQTESVIAIQPFGILLSEIS